MEQIFISPTPKISIRKDKRYAYPYLEIRHNGKRIRIHLGCKILATQWCYEKGRAYISPLLCNLDNANNEIANNIIEAHIARYNNFIDYLRNNPCKANQLHDKLKNYMARPRKQHGTSQEIDVLKTIEHSVINNTEINERTARNNYIGKGLKALRAFSEYRESPINNFDMIGPDLIDEFVEYLKSGKYTNNGKPYAIGSINSIIKYAVSAIKCLSVTHLPKAKAVTISAPQLTNKTADSNEIALRDDEVLKLWHYKPKTKQDEEIRDMFLLLCLTGQRVGDLDKLEGGITHIKGIPCLKIVQEKCSHKLANDIVFPLAINILDKYHSSLPLTDIRKRINTNIGRIAQEANINGTEQISTHYQGADKPTVTNKERWSLIHTHTGRRTFVSVLSVHGWSYERIGKYTGQSTKTVALYDKSTSIDRRIYEQSSPSDRLEVVGESPQPIPLIPSQKKTERFPTNIEEARQILSFLGIETEEQDLSILIGMICLQERNILNKCARQIDITTIKELFNTNLPLKKRCDTLKYVIEGLSK